MRREIQIFMKLVILAVISIILVISFSNWPTGFGKIRLMQTLGIESHLLALSPDGKLLAIPSGPPQDRKIGVLPIRGGTTLKLYTVPDEELVHTLNVFCVTQLAFSPDNSLIAAGNGLGEIFIWRTKDGQLLHSLKGKVPVSNPRMLKVNTLIFSPDSQNLVSGVGGQMDVWRVVDGQLRYSLSHKQSHGDISPNGEILAIGSSVDKITFYRLRDGTRLRQLEVNGRPKFSADGKLLAISYSTSYRRDFRQKVLLYRLEDDTVLGTLPGLDKQAFDLTFSPDGRYLAATYTTGGKPPKFGLFGPDPIAIIFSPFFPPARSHLTLWHLSNFFSDEYFAPQDISTQKMTFSTLTFSSDGKTLVSGGDAIRLWRVPD